jgi:ketosteroid isomerase-like protein
MCTTYIDMYRRVHHHAADDRRMVMSKEDEVQIVSDKFYSGLDRMDVSALPEIWSHRDDVTTMHPMGGEQVGWEEVRTSFEGATGLMTDSHVELIDQRIYVGEDLAYETGIERGRAKLSGEPVEFEHRVTNVYRLEDGKWKMIHHHTDVSTGLVEILQRRQAA